MKTIIDRIDVQVKSLLVGSITNKKVTNHLNKIGNPNSVTIAQLAAYIHELKPGNCSDFAKRLLGFFETNLETVASLVDALQIYIIGDQEIMVRWKMNEQQARDEYPHVAAAAEIARAQRDRREKGFRKMAGIWGEDIARKLLDLGFFQAGNSAKAIQALANKEKNWRLAVQEIN